MSEGGPAARRPFPARLETPVWVVVAVVLLAVAWLARDTGRILSGDAARYAVLADTMRTTGDWIVPTIGGEPYFRKPPLLFWMAGGTMQLLGPTSLAAMLPSIVGGVLLLVAIALWTPTLAGAPDAGRRAGVLAAFALLANRGFFATTATLRMESWLQVLCLAAVVCLERARGARAAPWLAGFWACVGAGVLLKGPAGLLPLVVTASAAAALRDGHPFSRRAFWLTLPVGVAVALPWYGTMSARFGAAFWDVHVFEQTVDRVGAHEGGVLEALWDALRFLGVLVPLAAAGAWIGLRRTDRSSAGRRAVVTAVVWVLVILVWTGTNVSGYGRYAYQAMAPAAALAGLALAALVPARVRLGHLVSGVLVLGGVLFVAARLGLIRRSAKSDPAPVVEAARERFRGPDVPVLPGEDRQPGNVVSYYLRKPPRFVTYGEIDAGTAPEILLSTKDATHEAGDRVIEVIASAGRLRIVRVAATGGR